MKTEMIKNIAHQQGVTLANEVSFAENQIVSKTLAQNPYVSLTLFAFDKQEQIGTHDSSGDALVYVFEGTGEFTVDGQKFLLNAGEAMVMPAKKPHSVYAPTAFKMLLAVIFPVEK